MLSAMDDLEGNLLESLRAAWEEHDRTCDRPPYVVLLNQGNYELLEWDEVLGLPVLPDPRVEPMKCRLVCGPEGWAGEFQGRRVVWVDGQAFVSVAEDPPEAA